MTKSLMCILLLVTWPLTALWRGYVITVLWIWFAVPSLGVRTISIYEAVAAVILISAVMPWQTSDAGENDKPGSGLQVKIFLVTFGPALLLLMGWIWKTLQWGQA